MTVHRFLASGCRLRFRVHEYPLEPVTTIDSGSFNSAQGRTLGSPTRQKPFFMASVPERFH